jgi:hypothetical protein
VPSRAGPFAAAAGLSRHCDASTRDGPRLEGPRGAPRGERRGAPRKSRRCSDDRSGVRCRPRRRFSIFSPLPLSENRRDRQRKGLRCGPGCQTRDVCFSIDGHEGYPSAEEYPSPGAARLPHPSWRAKGQWFESRQTACKEARSSPPSRRSRRVPRRRCPLGAWRWKRKSRLPARKRRANAGPFQERLKGFEPSTFCMGKQNVRSRASQEVLEKSSFRAIGGRRSFPAFTAKSRGFPD